MAATLKAGDQVVITGGIYAARLGVITRLTAANDGSPVAWVRRDGDSDVHLYPVEVLRPTGSPVGVGDWVVVVSTGTYAGQVGLLTAIDTTGAEPVATVVVNAQDQRLPVRVLRPAHRTPVVATSPIWSAVMARADHRCQCPAKHHKAHRGGRCYAGAGEGLITGPAVPGPNPARSSASTAAAPVAELLGRDHPRRPPPDQSGRADRPPDRRTRRRPVVRRT